MADPEIYKAKVVSCVQVLDRHNQPIKTGKGYYRFAVTFEGDKTAAAFAKEQVHPHFIPGKEVEFTANVKEDITFVNAPKSKKGGYTKPAGWVPKSPGEVKRDNVYNSINAAVKLVIEGKVKWEEFDGAVDTIQGAVNTQVDNIKDE